MLASLMSGIRVLELGHIVAGPFAGLLLVDLGAEVIKVERPGGDPTRSLPDMYDSIFVALNRGKKSVVLDLKTEGGRRTFLDLARKCHVLIENLGPGVAERLGVGFRAVSNVNPEIVYVSIKGFGSSLYEDRPALDVVAQAVSGLMSVTGFPRGEPVRVGTSIADMSAGLFGVLQAVAALYAKSKDKLRGPVYIEAPLVDSVLSFMTYWVTYYSLLGADPEPIGSGHKVWSPYRAFKTVDGWVFIGVTSNRHWEGLCKALKLEELARDERFSTNEGRVKHKELVERIVQERVSKMRRDEVVEFLSKHGVPVAPIQRMSDVVRDPYIKARGLLREVRWMDKLVLTSSMPYFINSEKAPNVKTPPPKLGEHTKEVLLSLLGYSEKDLERLRREGAIS